MKARATSKYVGTSSRKLGLVAALVRGRTVSQARNLLAQTPKRAAGPVGLALSSAIANAENNHNLRQADLIVESVLIGPGPTLKRARPRARGSASAIRKRSSHITVIVSDTTIASKSSSKAAKSQSTIAPKKATINAKPTAQAVATESK